MGKKIKKGVKGEASQYVTRSKAIRKLQLTLKDFRRLCILKGIYPREPRKKFEGNTKTYYHVKDINYLQHEKILNTFRQIKAHLKKYKKALHRDEKDKAEKLKLSFPKYTVHHLVKERYPTFADSLKDLDDPLCLVNLFAAMQAHKTYGIPNDKIQLCVKLAREFNLYVIKSRSLRKVFLSIKGIYYQADIQGQTVTWITPYYFTQKLPMDVDYKIMLTFLEFYEAMLKFVNYKLYNSLNLAYPPKVLTEVESNLNSFTYKSLEVAPLENNPTNSIEDEKYKISKEFDEVEDVKNITDKFRNAPVDLFTKLVFFCSREVPTYSLEFVILCFGGTVTSDDDASFNPAKVTHVITDRDPSFIKFEKNKEYIQPQWVYDSINNKVLLPVKDYAPGKPLPPHLSPFVTSKDEAYKPDRQKEIENLNGAVINDDDALEEEEEKVQEDQEEVVEDKFEIDTQIKKAKKQQKKDAKEQQELGKMVMSRKKQKLYEKAMFGKKKEEEKAEKLRMKKEKLKKMNKADKEKASSKN